MNQTQIDKLKENIKETPFNDMHGNIIMTYGDIHTDFSELQKDGVTESWFVADTIGLNCVIKTAQMLVVDVDPETSEVVNIMTEAEHQMHIDIAFDREMEPVTLNLVPSFQEVIEYFWGC